MDAIDKQTAILPKDHKDRNTPQIHTRGRYKISKSRCVIPPSSEDADFKTIIIVINDNQMIQYSNQTIYYSSCLITGCTSFAFRQPSTSPPY